MLNPSSVQYILLKYFFTSLYWRHMCSVAEVEVGGTPVPPTAVPPLHGTSPFPLEFLHIHSSCCCQNSHKEQEMVRTSLTFWDCYLAGKPKARLEAGTLEGMAETRNSQRNCVYVNI